MLLAPPAPCRPRPRSAASSPSPWPGCVPRPDRGVGDLARLADGDHHADVAVRGLAAIAEEVEYPRKRHHRAVLRANAALDRVEIGAGGHQLRGAAGG